MQGVRARRLAAQHIARPAHASARAVVAWMGAVQAQDHAASLWAIGLRMRAPKLATIRRAIERGEILRTWPMRGTLHFVTAEDARGLVARLAPRALAKAASRERELGITTATLAKARRALKRALSGRATLARPEAYATLERAGVRTSGYRGVHVLGHLAQEGMLCVGPHEGKQPTVALLDDLARGSRSLDLSAVAQRYVRSHGPAAVADLAWWTGETIAAAREALGSADLREAGGLWSARRLRIFFLRSTSTPSPTRIGAPRSDAWGASRMRRSAC